MRDGLNIAGFITAESGIGHAIRGTIAACDAISIPTALSNVNFTPSRRSDTTYQDRLTNEFPYDTSLIHINPDCLDLFFKTAPDAFKSETYRIAYWVWEVPTVPSNWKKLSNQFDEIWTPSTYCQKILEEGLGRAVKVVPHCVSTTVETPRRGASTASENITFFSCFDFLSIFERKNPLAIIESFLEAFPRKENVELIIKSINAEKDPTHHKLMEVAASKDDRITYSNEYCSHQELLEMIASANAFVSLHRAEGFGLSLAEAALLETPIITTGFSGCTDFLHSGIAHFVDCEYTDVPKIKPYPNGGKWANPRIESAAHCMRRIYECPEEAKQMATRAKEEVREMLSPERVGAMIQTQLAQHVILK